jgi:hypothetical protein
LGQPVSGLTVRFTAPGSGVSCTFTGSATQDVVTNASGVATSVTPQANASTGSYTVTAGVPSYPSVPTANFTLNNSAAGVPEPGPPMIYQTM